MKRWFIKNELRVSDGDLLLDRSKIDLFRGNKIDLSAIFFNSDLSRIDPFFFRIGYKKI